jgi:hypothetical protein
MKKMFLMIILPVFATTVGMAQIIEQSDISTSERGHIVLEKKQEKESIACMDRILLKKDGKTEVLFDSEGRSIQKVLEEDLDGDSIPELLVQMDLGGSGGFKEFALLKSDGKTYQNVWEETGFAAGEAVIEDRNATGKKSLYIDYTDTDSEPEKASTAAFSFVDGEFRLMDSPKQDK